MYLYVIFSHERRERDRQTDRQKEKKARKERVGKALGHGIFIFDKPIGVKENE